MPLPPFSARRRLLLFLALWGLAATLAGAGHALTHLPAPAVPLLIASLIVSFSWGLTKVAWLRAGAAALGERAIVSVHLVRFIGVYFLWLQGEGRLPAEFAQRAGWGDIAAAAGALLLLFWPEGSGYRRVFLWWNLFGAADLLVAVGTGGWLNLTRPGSMNEMAALPLTLVPLWLVPVMFASHLYLLRTAPAASRPH